MPEINLEANLRAMERSREAYWLRYPATSPVKLRWRDTWLIWDKDQAGAGTDRGSLDSASAPNVTAPVESVLVFYRGSWRRDGFIRPTIRR